MHDNHKTGDSGEKYMRAIALPCSFHTNECNETEQLEEQTHLVGSAWVPCRSSKANALAYHADEFENTRNRNEIASIKTALCHWLRRYRRRSISSGWRRFSCCVGSWSIEGVHSWRRLIGVGRHWSLQVWKRNECIESVASSLLSLSLCPRRQCANGERSVVSIFRFSIELIWHRGYTRQRTEDRERKRETMHDVCSLYATDGRTNDGSVDHSLKLATSDEQINVFIFSFEMLDTSFSLNQVQD